MIVSSFSKVKEMNASTTEFKREKRKEKKFTLSY